MYLLFFWNENNFNNFSAMGLFFLPSMGEEKIEWTEDYNLQ